MRPELGLCRLPMLAERRDRQLLGVSTHASPLPHAQAAKRRLPLPGQPIPEERAEGQENALASLHPEDWVVQVRPLAGSWDFHRDPDS